MNMRLAFPAAWLSVMVACLHRPVSAEETSYRTETNLAYRTAASTDASERWRLDLYLPAGATGFPTVVWFHGGGLRSGEKSIPAGLKNQGIAVAAANYRLSPQVQASAAIEDAAAAVAWTMREIESRGGASSRVFVAGHSAGAYLAAMVALDRRWLRAHDIDANDLAGALLCSGHSITHFTIRAERGMPEHQPVIDEYAPLFHVRSDAAPLLLITGDREQELLGRYEETAYFARMLKVAGHRRSRFFELQGFDHNDMLEPACPLMLKFIENPPEAGPRE